MKKQLLACMLVLTSITMHNVQASQMASDYLSKFKLLSAGFPDMKSHYATLRAGCVNASWLAKNPAVQKYVQNNFDTIAKTMGGFFATVVSLFIVRSIYRSCNDYSVDSRLKTDLDYYKQVYGGAFRNVILTLIDRDGAAVSKTEIPLYHPDRYGKLGTLTVFGNETAQKGHYSSDSQLNLLVSDDIVQSNIWFALMAHVSQVFGSVESQSRIHTSPFIMLSQDAKMRMQLCEAMANYMAEQRASEAYNTVPVGAHKYEVIDVPKKNNVRLTRDKVHSYELLLTDGDRIVWPNLSQSRVNLQQALLPKLLPNETFAVKDSGQLVGRVSTQLKEAALDETKPYDIDVPRDMQVQFTTTILDSVEKSQRVVTIDNVNKKYALQDWLAIRDALVNNPEAQQFVRTPNDSYVPGTAASFTHDDWVKKSEVFTGQPICSNSVLPGAAAASSSSMKANPHMTFGDLCATYGPPLGSSSSSQAPHHKAGASQPTGSSSSNAGQILPFARERSASFNGPDDLMQAFGHRRSKSDESRLMQGGNQQLLGVGVGLDSDDD